MAEKNRRQFRGLRLRGAVDTAAIRTATFEDREHVVVPVVALVEGVIWPVNAETPELVLAEALAKAPLGWNGEPVVPDHPAIENQRVSANRPDLLERYAFGRLFNASQPEEVLRTKKLTMEAWLDPVKAAKVGPLAESVIARCRAGEAVEVSVGAFVVTEDRAGSYGDQQYKAVWLEITPDHLAMLPEGARGACSVEMGCGAPRAARVHVLSEQGMAVEEDGDRAATGAAPAAAAAAGKEQRGMDREKLRDRFLQRVRAAQEDSPSDVDVRNALDRALRADEPGYLGIDSVFPETAQVVYGVMPAEALVLYRRGYEVAADGAVTLAGDKEEVRDVRRFEPVTTATDKTAAAGCTCGGKQAAAAKDAAAGGKTVPNTKMAERIKALIECAHSPFTAADTAYLEGLEEARLAELEQHAAGVKAASEAKAAAEADAQAAKAEKDAAAEKAQAAETALADAKAAAAKPKTLEEYLAVAPAEIKDIVADHRAREAAHRADLSASIKAAAKDVYTDDELAAKTTAELEKLSRVAGAKAPATDFSARPAPRAAETHDDVAPQPPSLVEKIKAARKNPAA